MSATRPVLVDRRHLRGFLCGRVAVTVGANRRSGDLREPEAPTPIG